MAKRTLEFAVRKHILKSGKVVHTPVARTKRISLWFPDVWTRITLVEGRYKLLDLDFEPDLTYEQCSEHIINYQNQLRRDRENEVETIEYHLLETQSI